MIPVIRDCPILRYTWLQIYYVPWHVKWCLISRDFRGFYHDITNTNFPLWSLLIVSGDALFFSRHIMKTINVYKCLFELQMNFYQSSFGHILFVICLIFRDNKSYTWPDPPFMGRDTWPDPPFMGRDTWPDPPFMGRDTWPDPPFMGPTYVGVFWHRCALVPWWPPGVTNRGIPLGTYMSWWWFIVASIWKMVCFILMCYGLFFQYHRCALIHCSCGLIVYGGLECLLYTYI